jgi:hypothetical protein
MATAALHLHWLVCMFFNLLIGIEMQKSERCTFYSVLYYVIKKEKRTMIKEKKNNIPYLPSLHF